MAEYYALVSYYGDGSAKPEVLRIYESESDAIFDMEMIERADPGKDVRVCPAYFQPALQVQEDE